MTVEASYRPLAKEQVPAAIHGWAQALVGTRRNRRKHIVAGWEWDGGGPVVLLILAPSGNEIEDIPHAVWVAAQNELYEQEGT